MAGQLHAPVAVTVPTVQEAGRALEPVGTKEKLLLPADVRTQNLPTSSKSLHRRRPD